MSGLSSFHLNEVVLLLQALRLLFANLLLTELSLVVVFLAHTIQVVFHLFLLPANLLNGCQLLSLEVAITEVNLLSLFLLTLAHGLFVCL